MNTHFSLHVKRTFSLLLALLLLLSLTVTVNASSAGDWTYYWPGNEWINGEFHTEDADLVYEDDQLYDWYVTISPEKKAPSQVDIVATIRDAYGNTISSCRKTVAGTGQGKTTPLCSWEDFPQLTTAFAGDFTLQMDILSEGICYASLAQSFRRTHTQSAIPADLVYLAHLGLQSICKNVLSNAQWCSGLQPGEVPQTNISVGFGRTDVSPAESVPLRGYGFSSGRMSTEVVDPLYATCIAITDSSGNTVLLFSLDMTNSYGEVTTEARQQISQATGIPFDAIMVAATHNHASPDLLNFNEATIPRYIEMLQERMVEAAVAALADRAPTRIYTTSVQTEKLNFVRRYTKTYDGTETYESEADGQMLLVRFQRKDKKDVILANFQTHPHMASSGTSTQVTSDLIASFRMRMEKTMDCHFAYFTGASGNVNHTSKFAGDNITKDYIHHGLALADYAIGAYDTFQEISADSVKITKTIYQGEVDHTLSRWGDLCSQLVDYYLKTGKTDKYAASLKGSGVKNIYHANAVALRSKMPAIQDIPIYAISLGDLAFVTVPFEMFDTNGMQIKEGSPFGTTFVLTSSNDHLSYLPSKQAFSNGGYEVNVTLFRRGTAEKLVRSYLDMLSDLHSEK